MRSHSQVLPAGRSDCILYCRELLVTSRIRSGEDVQLKTSNGLHPALLPLYSPSCAAGAPRHRARGARGSGPVSGAAAAGWRVPAEPTVPRLNSQGPNFRVLVSRRGWKRPPPAPPRRSPSMASFEERALLRQLHSLGVDIEHERERACDAEAAPPLSPTRAGGARAWHREMQKQWAQEALVRPPPRLAMDGRDPRVAMRSHRHPIPNARSAVAQYQLSLEEKAVQAWRAGKHWAPFVRPDSTDERLVPPCPTGRLCWEPYEEHGLHPTKGAQEKKVAANRQRQLQRHGFRPPSNFVQEREVAAKQFVSAGVPNGKEPPPIAEKLGVMMAARSKRAKDLTPRYKWQR